MGSIEGVTATHYTPDGSFRVVEADLSELEMHAMDMSMDLAEQALRGGNPPVGAVLIDLGSEQVWGASTSDKTERHIMAHAEMRAYDQAQPTVGDELEDCVLVTTSQPCTSCTPPYVEGKIGRIIYAAARSEVWPVTGIMRPRNINMHELLVDGKTDTTVIGGYRAEEALAKFALWGQQYAEVQAS
ncbi:MAG TPA: deaminase [Candidatus Saccharimonadales bacterium]|nr:deaminase [Candidatus Saccharimonadales bacterium]